MSLGKGRWKNRHKGNQSTPLSCFHVVLLSLVEDDLDGLMLETKQKLGAFNFLLNREHGCDRRVFSLRVVCILRNSLRCFANGDLGRPRELFPLCVLCPFFGDTRGTSSGLSECPWVTYRDRKGRCLKLGSLRCGSPLAVLRFDVCNVWRFSNYQETLTKGVAAITEARESKSSTVFACSTC